MIFCSFFFFFHCWCVHRIGALSKNRKKRKKTPLRHRSPASRAGIRVRHVSNTGTSPKIACRCNLNYNLENAYYMILKNKYIWETIEGNKVNYYHLHLFGDNMQVKHFSLHIFFLIIFSPFNLLLSF